jgi:hypothetical protein
MSRFSRTVIRAKQCLPSGDSEIPCRTTSCGGTPEISSPANRIVPCLGGVRPEIDRRVVDLPAPLDPSIVTISPSSTVSDTPFSASMLP